MIAENLAEEEGFKALPQPGHKAQDHVELILRFCRAAGLTDEEVRNMKMPPAWWARSLYYYQTVATEPVGVVLAMQSTQEGQMPGLISEVLLPAFEKHYGFKRAAPEIEFFTEHDSADVEHSRRQSDLCARYLNTPELEARPDSRPGDLRIALGVYLGALSIRSPERERASAAWHRMMKRAAQMTVAPSVNSNNKADITTESRSGLLRQPTALGFRDFAAWWMPHPGLIDPTDFLRPNRNPRWED